MSIPIKDLLDLVVARGGTPSSFLDVMMARGGGASVLREVEEWVALKRAAAPPPCPAQDALAALQDYEDEADVLHSGGGAAAAAPQKKRPGRPPKKAAAALEELAAASAPLSFSAALPAAGEKKRRGRPPKSAGGTAATTATLAAGAAAAVVLDGEETEPEEEARGAGGGSSAGSVSEEKKVRFKWAVFIKELGLTAGHQLRFRARDQAKKEHILLLNLITFKDKLALQYEAHEPGEPTPVAAQIKTALGNFRPDAQHAKKGVDVPASGHKDWEMEHAGKWYRLADPIWNDLVWGGAAFVHRA